MWHVMLCFHYLGCPSDLCGLTLPPFFSPVEASLLILLFRAHCASIPPFYPDLHVNRSNCVVFWFFVSM